MLYAIKGLYKHAFPFIIKRHVLQDNGDDVFRRNDDAILILQNKINYCIFKPETDITVIQLICRKRKLSYSFIILILCCEKIIKLFILVYHFLYQGIQIL